MPTPPARKKTASPPAPKAQRDKLLFRFRMRVTRGDVIAVGPGKISLLEAIASTGSITSAAKSLDMSYRRAWLLLDDINQSMKTPAVDSAKGGTAGGGSILTEAGCQLIALYRRIEETAAQACQHDMQELQDMLKK